MMVTDKRPKKQQISPKAAIALRTCSWRWMVDYSSGETPYPIKGMVLSVARIVTGGTSNNRGEVGFQRWTPPGANGGGVTLEDRLDLMSIAEAERYVHPPAIRYDRFANYVRGGRAYDPVTQEPTFFLMPVCYHAEEVEDGDMQSARLKAWPRVRTARVRYGYDREELTSGTVERFPEYPVVSLF